MAVAPVASTAADVKLADHTRHQIALRLLPFLFILYITNYLDRTSVAYAAIGMSRTVGFNDRVFGLGAGIFFVSYVALQIPGALMIERWSARRCITSILIAWGSLTALTGLVHTPGQLYGARLLLRCGGGRVFPWRRCVPEPLVHSRGSRQGRKQFHGGHSAVIHRRVAARGMDSRASLVRN